jgi:hypothetical protein
MRHGVDDLFRKIAYGTLISRPCAVQMKTDRKTATEELRSRILMSIDDELLNLARLCRWQAQLTQDRAVKQTLRTLGEHYESEAGRLQEQLSAQQSD